MTIRSALLILFLLFVLIFLQYRLWFEHEGIKGTQSLRQKLNDQLVENAQLRKSNEELLFQVKRLQNSQDALEARARTELGMIKKGETYYQVVKSG